MSRTRLSALLALAPAFAAASFMGGCRLLKRGASAPTPAAAPTAKPGPELPKIDYATVRPNELGRIPVIMYHEIKGTQNKSLTRSVADFKQDLETMLQAGFYPVNLGDVASNRIDVPAGKSPIVLTFDDARASQFKLTETANAQKIDPDCAVGILDAFHKQHPKDWPMRATFFILPKSKYTLEPFGQLGLGDQKMQYLVQQGMEIGNHTTSHHSLRPMNAAQIQEELGNANNAILAAAPSAKVTVFAAPMGQFPRDKKLWQYLHQGTYKGTPYNYKLVMLAAWRPMPSPSAAEFNPAVGMERIDSINGTNGVRDWIKKLSSSGGMYARYISDGDPNVVSYPKVDEKQANVSAIKGEGKLAYAYTAGGAGGAKPIVGSDTPTPRRSVDTTPPGGKAIVSEAKGPAKDPVPNPGAPAAAADSGNPAKPISGVGG